MKIPVDVWLRGTDFATTESIDSIARQPEEWLDDDVRGVLEGMLRAMHRLKHPAVRSTAPDRAHSGQAEEAPPIALRGLSWIVNPYDDGGVVIAIEITMGAAIAGPINIDKAALEAMIARVLAQGAPSSQAIH